MMIMTMQHISAPAAVANDESAAVAAAAATSTQSMSIATWASDQYPNQNDNDACSTVPQDPVFANHTSNHACTGGAADQTATSSKDHHDRSVDSFDAQLATIDRNLRWSEGATAASLAYPNLVDKYMGSDETLMPPPPPSFCHFGSNNRATSDYGINHVNHNPSVLSSTHDSESFMDYTAALERALEENDEPTIQRLLDKAGDYTAPCGTHRHRPSRLAQAASHHDSGYEHQKQAYTNTDTKLPPQYTVDTSFDAAAARIYNIMHEQSDDDYQDDRHAELPLQYNVQQQPQQKQQQQPQPHRHSLTIPEPKDSELSIDLFDGISMLSAFSGMSIDRSISIAASDTGRATTSSQSCPETIVLTEHDVIVGPGDVGAIGSMQHHHVGNRLYHQDFTIRHARYARSKNEGEKLAIRQELLTCVAARGGRFVRQCSGSDSGSGSEWVRLSVAEMELKVRNDLSQKCYVDNVSIILDVRLGRGGHCTNDPGHQRFLNQKDVMRVAYKETGTNVQLKGQIAQDLVDWVYATGGRFVKEDCNQWYIVDNDAALHKAKQALRTARKRRPETEGF